MAAQHAATSSKKRLCKRGYKIYKIKYGPSGVEHQAYARRLSERGLFINSNLAVYPTGTQLVLQIEIEGKIYAASGLVRNASKTDARLIHIIKPGMGVEFTDISPEFKTILASSGI